MDLIHVFFHAVSGSVLFTRQMNSSYLAELNLKRDLEIEIYGYSCIKVIQLKNVKEGLREIFIKSSAS